MKKVYVFFKEQVYDFDVLTQDVFVYENKEDAVKDFNAFIKEEKDFAVEEGWEIEEGNNSFSSYDSGSYAQNHTEAWLKEKEVQ
jgi:hypothetical protein